MAKLKLNEPELSNDELRQFADLLMLLLDAHKKDLKRIDNELNRLPKRRNRGISGATSFNRYIADIAVYLKNHGEKLITDFPTTKISRYRSNTGKKGKSASDDINHATWIRDFMLDLHDCFVVPGKKEADRVVLKKLEDNSRTFRVYFWHWLRRAKRERELQGQVLEGNLTIEGNWITANFDYQPPSGSKISYSGNIELREETVSGAHGETENHRTYYSTLTEKDVESRKADKLMVVLTVQHTHPDDTVLTGTFTGADLFQGYPAMGRIFLIANRLLELSDESTPEQHQQVTQLESFARTFVAYQTRLLRPSSFVALDDIPGFKLWQDCQNLFSQPLHGYFFKAIQREQVNHNEHGLVHFQLKVDATSTSAQPSQAIIEYDDPNKNPTNKGYLRIEPWEGHEKIVFRGEFDFLPEQNRFRFQIMFAKSPESEWYFGTIMGQNRSRQNLLLGRFALRKEPLDSKWLGNNLIGELMQYDRSLANFLLEINQHIPTETLPLYQQIGWPHLPRPHQTPEEMNFTGDMDGEYLCFALIRENHKTDKYKIAAYPLKIYPDGRLVMKFKKQEKRDGTEYPVEYYGRAFNNTGASRLFLYFDMRREQAEKKTFHLSMYFTVQPSSPIQTAYGVSNRFVHTEVMPEARMEVLIELVDTTFDKTEYRTYDPFLQEDRQQLNQLAPNLIEFLGGRANRLILPNSKLQPNRPIPHRQDRFRTLHIQAALYEIATETNNATNCINLLQEAYRHGFGSVATDKKYLKKELTKDLLKTTLSRWKESERNKIATELQSLWGLSIDVP